MRRRAARSTPLAWGSLGVVSAVLQACASATIAEGEGRGLVSVDRSPPAGAEQFGRPTWSVGDRFVFRRGGALRLEFGVVEADGAGYAIREESTGLINRLDPDLGQLGQELPGEPQMTRLRAPVDPQYTWPLWVGKQWSGHYLRKAADGSVLPLLAHYRCDARETVTVPAGSFETLRIWRRLRLAIEGNYLDQHEIVWYAPAVGFFVRRLQDNTLTELEEFHRQG